MQKQEASALSSMEILPYRFQIEQGKMIWIFRMFCFIVEEVDQKIRRRVSCSMK